MAAGDAFDIAAIARHQAVERRLRAELVLWLGWFGGGRRQCVVGQQRGGYRGGDGDAGEAKEITACGLLGVFMAGAHERVLR
ncbi:hypothetical protein D9M69_669420 [compost metagenome]